MMAVLRVATPEGDSGKIMSSAGDYLFRYHEDAKAQAAISLLKNKSVPFSLRLLPRHLVPLLVSIPSYRCLRSALEAVWRLRLTGSFA
jgi:hypothetical protein